MTSGFIDTVPTYRSCKVRVYIFIYVCIYKIPELSVYWILGAVHTQPWNVCLRVCHMTSQHLWGKQRVWQLHRSAPSAGRAFFFFSLAWGASSAVQWPEAQEWCLRIDTVSWRKDLSSAELTCTSLLCWVETNLQPWCRQSDFCSVWMYRSSLQVKVLLY